ncbi:DUF4181 domain-containing protein [Virgibacillus ndiopensis]|uniref:DUF4181 domain-containing protein n=1 Tax=Virgibacillus ndiopensis TaxID=2004408 RepID=UPI000C07DBBC|nr:DUF4181 domain-containing protein [Virgibacillus ndiopensis]
MEQYLGPPPGFWSELLIIVGAMFIILVGLPAIVRRILGADKRKWFSRNYINELHEKIDKGLRICGIFFILFSPIVFQANPLITVFILTIFGVLQLVFQAYFEWKYAENRSNYKLSVIEACLTIVVLAGVFMWFGLGI